MRNKFCLTPAAGVNGIKSVLDVSFIITQFLIITDLL